MLVLTRRPDQKIEVGDNIVITVIEIQGKQVTLGIEAPASVDIYRAEVAEARRQERRRGGSATDPAA